MSPILGGIGGVSVRGFGHFPNLYFSSFDSIATVTVGAGGTSTVTFSSIPAGYTHLQVRFIAAASGSPANIRNLYMRFNDDGTSGNYKGHYLLGTGASALSGGTDTDNINVAGNTPVAYSNIFNAGVVDILDYANTNKYKTARSLNGMNNNSTVEDRIGIHSGFWMNTNAITKITFSLEASANFLQYSHFALYGIKVA